MQTEMARLKETEPDIQHRDRWVSLSPLFLPTPLRFPLCWPFVHSSSGLPVFVVLVRVRQFQARDCELEDGEGEPEERCLSVRRGAARARSSPPSLPVRYPIILLEAPPHGTRATTLSPARPHRPVRPSVHAPSVFVCCAFSIRVPKVRLQHLASIARVYVLSAFIPSFVIFLSIFCCLGRKVWMCTPSRSRFFCGPRILSSVYPYGSLDFLPTSYLLRFFFFRYDGSVLANAVALLLNTISSAFSSFFVCAIRVRAASDAMRSCRDVSEEVMDKRM